MKLRRRTFLAGAAASTVWSASYRLPAADAVEPFTFVIVSDTHLGRGDQQAPEQLWRQAADEIAELPGDFVLHLGDVVDGGREAYYPIYADVRKRLGKPIYEIPGNHDPAALFRKYVRREIDMSFDHRGVRFLLIGNAHVDSHLGFVTPEQIAWLDDRSRDAAERNLKLALCCHVPVHANKHPDRGWYVRPEDGQTALYALVERHRDRFLAFFHGHFHNGIRGWRDRGPLVEVCCPSNLYNQDRRLVEQKAPGFVVDELRPGYLLATLGSGRLTLRYKPLGAEVHGEYSADYA